MRWEFKAMPGITIQNVRGIGIELSQETANGPESVVIAVEQVEWVCESLRQAKIASEDDRPESDV
jgi:hypothetical protein